MLRTMMMLILKAIERVRMVNRDVGGDAEG